MRLELDLCKKALVKPSGILIYKNILHKFFDKQKSPWYSIEPTDGFPPFEVLPECNHAKAAKHLLGLKRRRSILKIDLHRFFEQIGVEKVDQFFYKNCRCDKRTSKILSCLCCVPLGPKGSNSKRKSIARGFATSPRLAVWCNLDIFLRLNHLVHKSLKGKDPRIAIYVDDIGITASRVSEEEMTSLLNDIKSLFSSSGESLKLNDKKTKIKSHKEGMEYVGITLLRNSLEVGKKAQSKRDRLKNELRGSLSKSEKSQIRRRYKATTWYKKYIGSL